MKAGRYELHEVLGTGAFATVYRGTDPRLDAAVAIKVLADNWSQDLDVRRRFRSEAVLLRRAQSEAAVPGVVNVFDIDETDDGRPFFVMSFADLGTLRERSGHAIWSSTDVAPIVDALADSIGALHRAGVVHRDLKPSNLLLRSDSGAKSTAGALMRPGERLLVGDLGMAKDAALESTTLSFAGGTARYMAPEQHQLDTTVDHRADIHAASVIVAELLAGSHELPAPGSILEDNLPSTLEPHIRTVLNQGVTTDPARRHASIDEWRTGVLAAFGAEVSPAASARRKKTLVALVTAFVSAAIAIATAVFFLADSADLEIVGPDEIVVGESSTYRLPDGEPAMWTDWTGAQVSAVEFEIVATLPGRLSFTATRDATQGERSVQVVESRRGPTINGPDSMRLGQDAVFTATLASSSASAYWIGPSGDRIETADYRFSPTETGDAVISLVSVDGDGIERGSRHIVAVDS